MKTMQTLAAFCVVWADVPRARYALRTKRTKHIGFTSAIAVDGVTIV
jgi:hypothetical protein